MTKPQSYIIIHPDLVEQFEEMCRIASAYRKPFEPRKLVLFYPADDVVDEDVYVSVGYLRRIRREDGRKVRQFGKRRHRKHIKMDRKKNPSRYMLCDMWSKQIVDSMMAPSLCDILALMAGAKSGNDWTRPYEVEESENFVSYYSCAWYDSEKAP